MANPPITAARIGVADERSVSTNVNVLPEDPAVSGPDLIIQIRADKNWVGGTGDPPPCLNGLRGPIADLLAGSFTAAFPGAFVGNNCAGGPDPANEAAAFGVWLTAPADTSAAQQLLDTSIGRAQRETIAFSISQTFFEAVAAQNFPANPSGSIHLHPPLELEFKSPDTVITKVRGTDTDPVPDVDFTETITEQFTGGPCHTPQWFTSTESLDKDSTWVDVIAVVLSPVPLLNFAGWYQAGEVAGAGPQQAQGVGSAVASAVMPLAIAIPGGTKLPIEYVAREEHNGGIEVDDGGMYVGGFIHPAVPREPFASLTGMTNVGLHVGGGDVEDTITVQTWDMRGKLTFAWTVNGKATPADASLTLSFNPTAGPFGTQNVAVKVTDEDGLVAQASLQVTASVEQPSGPSGKTSWQNPIHPA